MALYGVLLLCPAKFVLLWALQRREARDRGTRADPPASSDCALEALREIERPAGP